MYVFVYMCVCTCNIEPLVFSTLLHTLLLSAGDRVSYIVFTARSFGYKGDDQLAIKHVTSSGKDCDCDNHSNIQCAYAIFEAGVAEHLPDFKLHIRNNCSCIDREKERHSCGVHKLQKSESVANSAAESENMQITFYTKESIEERVRKAEQRKQQQAEELKEQAREVKEQYAKNLLEQAREHDQQYAKKLLELAEQRKQMSPELREAALYKDVTNQIRWLNNGRSATELPANGGKRKEPASVNLGKNTLLELRGQHEKPKVTLKVLLESDEGKALVMEALLEVGYYNNHRRERTKLVSKALYTLFIAKYKLAVDSSDASPSPAPRARKKKR
jgi:hypothetical protein